MEIQSLLASVRLNLQFFYLFSIQSEIKEFTSFKQNHLRHSTIAFSHMDKYTGKRVSGRIGVTGKGPSIVLRDSNNVNRSIQCCSRLGCSSRVSSTMQIGNPKKGQYSKPFSCSSNSKSIAGSSSKAFTSSSDIKKCHRNNQKGISTVPQGVAEVEISAPARTRTGSSASRDSESSVLNDIAVSATMEEVESSKTTLDTRSRRLTHQQSQSGSRVSYVGPVLQRNNSSRNSVQAARSSQSQPADSHRTILRNISYPSRSDVRPPSCSSSDSGRIRRADMTIRRGPEGESSSERGKRLSGLANGGNSNTQRNALASLSSPKRSLAQQALERARNRSSGGNTNVASIRTRRSVGGATRTWLSENGSERNSSLSNSVTISQLPQRELVINESAPTSLSRSILTEFPSSARSSYVGLPGSNNETLSNIAHSEDRAFQGLSVGQDGARRYNIGGIAEVLLALERIEQNEGITNEQLLMLEANFLLGSLGFYDRHRAMRLDIDNMSYEELLALEEKMGSVSTALTEEELSTCLTRGCYEPASLTSEIVGDDDTKCSICQEEYMVGDELGRLQCEHRYHVICIHQWLRQKNWCPICKSSTSPSSS